MSNPWWSWQRCSPDEDKIPSLILLYRSFESWSKWRSWDFLKTLVVINSVHGVIVMVERWFLDLCPYGDLSLFSCGSFSTCISTDGLKWVVVGCPAHRNKIITTHNYTRSHQIELIQVYIDTLLVIHLNTFIGSKLSIIY